MEPLDSFDVQGWFSKDENELPPLTENVLPERAPERIKSLIEKQIEETDSKNQVLQTENQGIAHPSIIENPPLIPFVQESLLAGEVVSTTSPSTTEIDCRETGDKFGSDKDTHRHSRLEKHLQLDPLAWSPPVPHCIDPNDLDWGWLVAENQELQAPIHHEAPMSGSGKKQNKIQGNVYSYQNSSTIGTTSTPIRQETNSPSTIAVPVSRVAGSVKEKINTNIIPAIGKKRIRRKKHRESFSIYIYKVLKDIHPEIGISSKAMSIMNSFLADLLLRISAEARKLQSYNNRNTLMSREIQAAVRLLLPTELAKHADSKGINAVIKYSSS